MWSALASITIDIDPEPSIGPLTLAWHGIMTAVGILVGGLVATRHARRNGLSADVVVSIVVVAAIAGIAGARLFFLALEEPGSLVSPADWLGTRGFAIYGAVFAAPLAAGIYIARAGLSVRYLDAIAYGFPLGLAVGRIGDVINGEHFGPATDAPWGIRYEHPDALVPGSELAYHSGGLYEVVAGLAIAAIVVVLASRLTRATEMLWTVIGLYAIARFVIFFWREDTEDAFAGLNVAQIVSLAALALAAGGLAHARKTDLDRRGRAAHASAAP